MSNRVSDDIVDVIAEKWEGSAGQLYVHAQAMARELQSLRRSGTEAVAWRIEFDDGRYRVTVARAVMEREREVKGVRIIPLYASPGKGSDVGVKELVWPDGEPKSRFKAMSGLVEYTIARSGEGSYWWGASTEPWGGQCSTLDEAKAAAQADYETRIRSTLK